MQASFNHFSIADLSDVNFFAYISIEMKNNKQAETGETSYEQK